MILPQATVTRTPTDSESKVCTRIVLPVSERGRGPLCAQLAATASDVRTSLAPELSPAEKPGVADLAGLSNGACARTLEPVAATQLGAQSLGRPPPQCGPAEQVDVNLKGTPPMHAPQGLPMAVTGMPRRKNPRSRRAAVADVAPGRRCQIAALQVAGVT
jgi:hypothetical protein